MCACVVLFCVFQRVSREMCRGTYTTAIGDSTEIGEIQRRSRKSPRSPLVAVGIIVCLRESIVLSMFAIVFVRFKWHDFCIGHATPVIYVMRISAKQLIRFLFETSDLRTYKMHIIAAYYCVLPKHLFAKFLTVADFKAAIAIKIKIFQRIEVHFYMWNGM